ncbi:MAG: hypothetical protein QNJ65_12205 [Xenococcaceae cyanobacterium MO_234.B1]|nr:hypothetical protein [Xenococcaceae cyanobacterium MO_234.B1]
MNPIEEKYNDCRQFLGEPIHEEQSTPCGRGRYVTYKNGNQDGSIHWTKETGAHETHGGIRAKWEELGWEKHYLGFPISDEQEYSMLRMVKSRVE